MLRDAKINVKSVLMFGLYLCLILYVFFWDKKFFTSRYSLLGVLICGFLCFLLKGKVKLNAGASVFGGIAFWTLAGLLLGGHISSGETVTVSVVAGFLVYLLMQNHAKSFDPIIIAMVLCAALYGIFVYLDMFAPELMMSINKSVLKDGSLQFYTDLSAWGYYPGVTGFNFMSGFFVTLFLAYCLYNVLFPKGKGTLIYVILTVLSVLATILVQKRSIFIASTVAVCCMIVFSFLTKKRIKHFIIAFLLIGVLFAAVYIFLQNSESGAKFLDRFNNSDDLSSGRFDIYEKLMLDWQKYFLFGNGTGASQAIVSSGAHNIYVQIIYDHGLVGLLLYVAWFILNLRYTLIRFKKVQGPCYEKRILFMSMFVQIIFLIYGFFGNPINDLCVFLLYVFFAGIAYAKPFIADKKTARHICDIPNN